MMMKLGVSRLNELFALISGDRSLYMPLHINDVTEFGKWNAENSVPALDKLNTVRSAKDFFFPQSEDIVSFKRSGKEITIEDSREQNEPFAVFGVRSCDAKSLEILDRVFLSDPVDTFYKGRRENAVVITAACFKPEETCFCASFDIDPVSPGGDISTWLLADTLYWESHTEKGNELTGKLKALLQAADANDEKLIASEKAKAKEVLAKLPFNGVKFEKQPKEKHMEIFNSPQWAELNPTCLGCGTCTFICPTCHCYDIQDFDTGSGVKRFRCWDSCMYSDFTLMAHGNPRLSQLERFRQRYMHKLVYFPDNNEGVTACVGCGRCVGKCPVSINIVKVAKALGAKVKEGVKNV